MFRRFRFPIRFAAGAIAVLATSICLAATGAANLTINPVFSQHNAGYQMVGDVEGLLEQKMGSPIMCAALESGKDIDRNGRIAGSIAQTVKVDPKAGRWLRFSIRGLPEDHFKVDDESLAMKIEFFGNGGKTSYDAKEKPIYPRIEQARKDLTVNGDHHVAGAATWQVYQLDVYIPFPQVDRVRLSVHFDHGIGAPSDGAFLITDFDLHHIDGPADLLASDRPTTRPMEREVKGKLIPLGGRWFYAAKEGEARAPQLFDYTNAGRLLYHDGKYEAPFDGNMTATLHKGNKDIHGNVVTSDRLITDNVTVRFDSTSMIIHTHGLPNHPTGRFPASRFDDSPGSNPNYIQEQDRTYYFPLEPRENPDHFVTDQTNSNHALNMGPIGLAVNGVVFFNPFDANSEDASNILDLCCGHPAQDNMYHYHKYPICIHSPWSDEGSAHSQLLGFAFDGFPIYGPYESKDVMAKDLTGEQALNAFNMHYDAERGWHYHVTPGQFPYLIGGYWGTVDRRDIRRPGRGMGGQRPPFGRGGDQQRGGFGPPPPP